MKYIILSALAVLGSTSLMAKPRTKQDIMASASRTINTYRQGLHKAPALKGTLEVLRQSDVYTVAGYAEGGYAIISNDDLLPEVLAYSASAFDAETTNDGLRWWLNAMEASARDIVASGVAARRVSPSASGYPARVPQLMSSSWGQLEPYNDLCPIEYTASGRSLGRCCVGCVATAMTQIMYYHKYPTQGTGSYTDMQTTDAWGNVTPLTVRFADYTYDYERMRDTYVPGNYTPEEARAVAELSYSVGVSFAMIYGTGASGTYSDSAAVSLRKHLGFPGAKLMDRLRYDETTWMNTIFDELSHNRPLMYSGADDLFVVGGGGHAFVFDGYDEQGLVHVNWGWYGRNDGYYAVSLLNPRIHNFHNQQDMVIGCEPPSQEGFKATRRVVTGAITPDSLRAYVTESQEGTLRTLDLSSATLPAGELPAKAFYGSRLQHIILPTTLTAIGDAAFGHCPDLVDVTFPEANAAQQYVVVDDVIYNRRMDEVIEVLPYYSNTRSVMADFTSLLSFAEGTRTLHPHAVDGCNRIRGVNIPATMTLIGSQAFSGTTTIKRLRVLGSTPAATAPDAFDGLDVGFTQLALPAGTSEQYRRTGQWACLFGLDNVYEMGTNVRARNAVRNVGEANPTFTYQVFGDYITGEPTITCEATADSPAGQYPIVVSLGTIVGKDVVLTNGMLTIIDPTGINAASADATPAATYRLDGTRVSGRTNARGVYIVGGRKVVR